jgi:hypothetical protein
MPNDERPVLCHATGKAEDALDVRLRLARAVL